jgi:hypothetical protein
MNRPSIVGQMSTEPEFKDDYIPQLTDVNVTLPDTAIQTGDASLERGAPCPYAPPHESSHPDLDRISTSPAFPLIAEIPHGVWARRL